ncbi:hypothetical protein D3C78_1713480 [compost metagenome]
MSYGQGLIVQTVGPVDLTSVMPPVPPVPSVGSWESARSGRAGRGWDLVERIYGIINNGNVLQKAVGLPVL